MNVSQIVSRDISGIRPQNDAVVLVSHTFRSKSVDSSMNLTNSLPKRLPLEVTFAPAIGMSRYENGGPITHVATPEFAEGFVRKYDFSAFANSNICKSV